MTKPIQAYGSSMTFNFFKCIHGPIHLSFSLVQTFQMLKKKFLSFKKKNFLTVKKIVKDHLMNT